MTRGAAEAVGEPAADGADQRAEQRAEEREEAALTGVSKWSANCTCSTWPKANPKPMNEPNVPM